MASPDETNAARWQRQWHGILNGFPDPDGSVSTTPDSMPRMNCDFRLHFDIWHLPPEALREAFSIFPLGAKLFERIEQHFARRERLLTAEQAKGLVVEGVQLLIAAGYKAPSTFQAVNVLYKEDVSLFEAFRFAGSPFVVLNDNLSERAFKNSGQDGLDAYFFLIEPLYRIRSAYALAQWIMWPLCSQPEEPDLTLIPYLVEEGGWSPGWDGEKLFIFDRRDRGAMAG
jgi:hypothetical protein